MAGLGGLARSSPFAWWPIILDHDVVLRLCGLPEDDLARILTRMLWAYCHGTGDGEGVATDEDQRSKGSPRAWTDNGWPWPVGSFESFTKGPTQCMALELMSAVSQERGADVAVAVLERVAKENSRNKAKALAQRAKADGTSFRFESAFGGKEDGFFHYAGDVWVQSTQRPEGGHHDLSFQLFSAEAEYYPFRNCGPTGGAAKGKEEPQLRSRVAVHRYLERDGMSKEELHRMESEMAASLKAAKEEAEAEVKEEAVKHAEIPREAMTLWRRRPTSPPVREDGGDGQTDHQIGVSPLSTPTSLIQALILPPPPAGDTGPMLQTRHVALERNGPTDGGGGGRALGGRRKTNRPMRITSELLRESSWEGASLSGDETGTGSAEPSAVCIRIDDDDDDDDSCQEAELVRASDGPPIKSELNSDSENESVEELERRLFRERCVLLDMLRAREERLSEEIVGLSPGHACEVGRARERCGGAVNPIWVSYGAACPLQDRRRVRLVRHAPDPTEERPQWAQCQACLGWRDLGLSPTQVKALERQRQRREEEGGSGPREDAHEHPRRCRRTLRGTPGKTETYPAGEVLHEECPVTAEDLCNAARSAARDFGGGPPSEWAIGSALQGAWRKARVPSPVDALAQAAAALVTESPRKGRTMDATLDAVVAATEWGEVDGGHGDGDKNTENGVGGQSGRDEAAGKEALEVIRDVLAGMIDEVEAKEVIRDVLAGMIDEVEAKEVIRDVLAGMIDEVEAKDALSNSLLLTSTHLPYVHQLSNKLPTTATSRPLRIRLFLNKSSHDTSATDSDPPAPAAAAEFEVPRRFQKTMSVNEHPLRPLDVSASVSGEPKEPDSLCGCVPAVPEGWLRWEKVRKKQEAGRMWCVDCYYRTPSHRTGPRGAWKDGYILRSNKEIAQFLQEDATAAGTGGGADPIGGLYTHLTPADFMCNPFTRRSNREQSTRRLGASVRDHAPVSHKWRAMLPGGVEAMARAYTAQNLAASKLKRKAPEPSVQSQPSPQPHLQRRVEPVEYGRAPGLTWLVPVPAEEEAVEVLSDRSMDASIGGTRSSALAIPSAIVSDVVARDATTSGVGEVERKKEQLNAKNGKEKETDERVGDTIGNDEEVCDEKAR